MKVRINGRPFDAEILEVIDKDLAAKRNLRNTGILLRVSPRGKSYLIPFDNITFTENINERIESPHKILA